MDENKKNGKQAAPPYLPYKTFRRFIETLKETTVPHRIDTSVLGKFSGSDVAALLPALKFLRLINEDQIANPLLDGLVQSYGTEMWKEKMKEIVNASYADIIADIPLPSATRKQLEEGFDFVSSAVKEKSVRFFITVASEAGIPLSRHITMRQKVSREKKLHKPKGEKPQKPLGGQGNGSGSGGQLNILPSGYREFPVPIKGKDPIKIWVPEDIAEEDWDSVKLMMDLTTELIRAYFGFPRNEEI